MRPSAGSEDPAYVRRIW